jgi:hypothetical protein
MLSFDHTLGHPGRIGAHGFCDEVNFHCRAPLGIIATFTPASWSGWSDSSKMHAKFVCR